ncbi:MAG: carbohydrate ABC transporter permease, partial [Clostridia bacterium]
MTKRTRGEKLFAVFNTIGMLMLSLIFLLPLWHVLMGSISDPLLVSANTGLILAPLGTPTLGGYQLVMQNSFILSSYLNTIIYVVCATLFGTALTILAAYAMSRKNLYFKGPIVFIVTFTMIFNGGLIPTYILIRDLGMLNTRWSLIIPMSVTAYNIIIMRTSFAAIPDALCEAATIDGAGHMRILFQIVLPVSKSILAVIVLFYAIQHWNAWFNASIYIKDRSLYPLQLTLREIVLLSTEQSIVADADGGD